LSRRIEHLARQSATAVRLQDLYKWGQGTSVDRLRVARFLHKEVSIRNAQLCTELHLLPFGLAKTKGVLDVVSSFSSYVDSLEEFPQPETSEDDQRFTMLLEDILEDNMKVVNTLGRGVQEVRESLGEREYEDIRSEIDLILDRFFIKRIGLRFLIQHHIESASQRPGISGIIHSNVAVGPILRQAAEEAQQLCRERYAVAPKVVVIGDSNQVNHLNSPVGFTPGPQNNVNLSHNRQFTYVPIHLHFSCSVLLQNACYAVGQSRSSQHCAKHPVHVFFAHGEEEVTIKVSDTGGGIARSKEHLAMSYFHSPEGAPLGPGLGRRHADPLGDGSPPGAGLPLARLHARYYGGEMVLKSIEGYGTDAFLFLNRLGQNLENLPHGVRVSPAMRDSQVGDVASIRLGESLGKITEAEKSFLNLKLADFREKRAVTPFSSMMAP